MGVNSMRDFEVSVIIPVYNAEKYVLRAINSALEQPEVKEVIVVDDGYADNAYELCKQIAQKEPRVKLYTHPNHENLGAAVSRNLGMLNASCGYIAFLDADDYFLPNRFRFTKETFSSDSSIDGLYEPVGYKVSTENALNKLQQIKRVFREKPDEVDNILSYAKTPYAGKDLFKSIIIGGNDGPHTDGVTIKRQLISKVGLFNPTLKLHQDTEYWLRICYLANLSPTTNHTKAVAIREMHDSNRTYNQNKQSGLKLWKVILSWASTCEMDKDLFEKILQRYQMLID